MTLSNEIQRIKRMKTEEVGEKTRFKNVENPYIAFVQLAKQQSISMSVSSDL